MDLVAAFALTEFCLNSACRDKANSHGGTLSCRMMFTSDTNRRNTSSDSTVTNGTRKQGTLHEPVDLTGVGEVVEEVVEEVEEKEDDEEWTGTGGPLDETEDEGNT